MTPREAKKLYKKANYHITSKQDFGESQSSLHLLILRSNCAIEFTTAFNSGVHHIRATLVISSFDCLCSFDRCSRCAYFACLKTFTILIFYIYRFFQCCIICLCLPLYLNLFYLPLVRKTRDPEYRLSDLRLREERIKISFSRNSTT